MVRKIVSVALIFLGVVAIIFFGMRALHALKKFDGHRPPPPKEVETDVELIRDWMTVSFIAKTYHIPEKIIFDSLKISPLGNHEKSLEDLNQDYYPAADGFVLNMVKTTILTHQPPPPPDSPPSDVPKPSVPAAP